MADVGVVIAAVDIIAHMVIWIIHRRIASVDERPGFENDAHLGRKELGVNDVVACAFQEDLGEDLTDSGLVADVARYSISTAGKSGCAVVGVGAVIAESVIANTVVDGSVMLGCLVRIVRISCTSDM